MSFGNWAFFNNGFAGNTVHVQCGVTSDEVTDWSFPGCELGGGYTFLCGACPYGLCFGFSSGGGSALRSVNGITAAVTHSNVGAISATMRQQVNVYFGQPNGITGQNFGITCLQSQASLIGAGSCYALMFDAINGSYNIKLCKMTTGIDYSLGSSQGSSYILLGQTSNQIWEPNVDNLIYLYWESDPYFLRGTRLVAQLNGAQLFDILHTGTDAIAATGSNGEGIYAQGATAGSVIITTSTAINPQTFNTVNGVSYPPSF